MKMKVVCNSSEAITKSILKINFVSFKQTFQKLSYLSQYKLHISPRTKQGKVNSYIFRYLFFKENLI